MGKVKAEKTAINKKNSAAKNSINLSNKKVKRRGRKLSTVAKPKPKTASVLYIGHLPHGFFEEQLRDYFTQFGKVKNVHLCRSKKSGRSKGFAFIRFANNKVTKVAAETMNNYLMCNRKIVAQVLDSQRVKTFKNKDMHITEKKFPLKKLREDMNRQKNLNVSDEVHQKKCKGMLKNVKKTLKLLESHGLHYNFKVVEDPYGFAETYLGKQEVDSD